MYRESITIEDALEVLNRATKADPQAMRELVAARMPCNAALRDDPTIQVSGSGSDDAEVGLLGIINGMFGIDEDGWGPLGAVMNNGALIGFERVTPEWKSRVPSVLRFEPKRKP